MIGPRLTLALAGGWLAFLAAGVALVEPILTGVSLACWIASLVAMYLDLASLDRRIGGKPPILWVLLAVALYVVAVPVYAYKRRGL